MLEKVGNISDIYHASFMDVLTYLRKCCIRIKEIINKTIWTIIYGGPLLIKDILNPDCGGPEIFVD